MEMQEMTAEEFEEFIQYSIHEMSRHRAKEAGTSPAECVSLVEEEVKKHLPEGRKTQGHYFYALKNETKIAGRLWFGRRGVGPAEKVFIFDVVVDEEYRGKGLGRFMLQWLERKTHQLGLTTISLHVFAYNAAARSLYESEGYSVTNLYMAKTVSLA